MTILGITFSNGELFLFSGACALFMLLIGSYIKNSIEAIDRFRNIFMNEREKIKVSNVQDFNAQEKAIFDIKRHLFFWQNSRLNRMWNDYKEAENKYRQALYTQGTPSNILIHYGDHKNLVISKIDKIINYL